MSVTVMIRDETTSGTIYNQIPLELPSERITVRELIRERVYQEVDDFNHRGDQEIFRGLVQPTDTEQVLNGTRPEFRLKKRRRIEWQPQFEKAIEAFERNGFLVLVGNQQAESLDQVFTIRSDTEVSFVKLTLLVGG